MRDLMANRVEFPVSRRPGLWSEAEVQGLEYRRLTFDFAPGSPDLARVEELMTAVDSAALENYRDLGPQPKGQGYQLVISVADYRILVAYASLHKNLQTGLRYPSVPRYTMGDYWREYLGPGHEPLAYVAVRGEGILEVVPCAWALFDAPDGASGIIEPADPLDARVREP